MILNCCQESKSNFVNYFFDEMLSQALSNSCEVDNRCLNWII